MEVQVLSRPQNLTHRSASFGVFDFVGVGEDLKAKAGTHSEEWVA